MSKNMNLSSQIETHCAALGVAATCPYQLKDADGLVVFSGYLPYFGSMNGLLISEIVAPDFKPNERHKLAASCENISVSFVNPLSILQQHEFIEALRDWGYFGENNSLPSFMK